ncbi:MAG: CoA transferase, partial [Phascolarctobacterium sp.]|nr:CoA transferase [Phascolarctobacterium sp.]
LEFKKRTMAEWEVHLKGKDTCVTPVYDFAEACAAEQTQANEMVMTVQDEELGEYKQIGFAMKLSKTPAKHSKRAPRLGEDNEEILGQLNKE